MKKKLLCPYYCTNLKSFRVPWTTKYNKVKFNTSTN